MGAPGIRWGNCRRQAWGAGLDVWTFHVVKLSQVRCINVPNDKARAVVDAVERDMSTTLATKSDLLPIRQEIDNKFALLSRDIESTRKGIESLRGSNRKDLETLRLSMTVRLGSMLFVGFGLMLAAMKLCTAADLGATRFM
jgi:hypothetical protein